MNRRRVIYAINADKFLLILNGKAKLDFPEGTTILDARYDWLRNNFELLATNEQFEEVSQAETFPTMSLPMSYVDD